MSNLQTATKPKQQQQRRRDSNSYGIQFEYGKTIHPHTNIEGRKTICYIYKGENILSEGISICHKNDNFNKDTGRKLALTRALRNVSEDINTKSFRAIFWEYYLNRHLYDLASFQVFSGIGLDGKS